jgi:hypothetical protein
MTTAEPEAQGPEPSVTSELYREWRSPRLGRTNPERLNNPVWEWLIASEWSAYAARKHFDDVKEQCADPGWSFVRFGRTATELADGRMVLIAGEHEDSYDSDFYIYNDVVVRHADGGIDIHGYPRDAFPPTDFHSATPAGSRIIVIGCLGYPADRNPGMTPVGFLDLDTFAMSRVATSGPQPGWIHRHEATLSDDGRAIVIRGGKIVRGTVGAQELLENADDWQLDLSNWRWDRLTERRWTQWRISRADGRPNRLWQLHSAWTLRDRRWAKEHRESMETMIRGQMEELTKEYGSVPDLELFGTLYRPPVHHAELPDGEGEYGVRRIALDDTIVRYIEQPHAVQMVVEGDLPDVAIAELTGDLRSKLAKIENTEYVVRKLS